MVRLTLTSLTSLLLSILCLGQLLGQDNVPRRLPPCNPELAPRIPLRRIPPVVQASAIQADSAALTAMPKAAIAFQPERLPPPIGYGPDFMLEEYMIQPGDELEIKFRFTPDLNETVTVRPDGLISLQIIGPVMAADCTPRELHDELVQAYTPALKNPLIVVHVRRFAANFVYVGGEVGLPARVPITGQLSILQAIIRVGGFKDTADERHVILRREGGYSTTLNLKADVKGHEIGNDVLLRPYDVIYVPKSRIAKVNLWVDQYIERLLPFSRSTGVFVSRELGSQ